jgi:hypothetical protein
MMISKLEKKKTRHHPAWQDRAFTVDGFTDFSFKAFSNAYEKSAAPLSKRRNGSGPIHHKLGSIYTAQTEWAILAIGAFAVWRYMYNK